jgi:hypothetical protein
LFRSPLILGRYTSRVYFINAFTIGSIGIAKTLNGSELPSRTRLRGDMLRSDPVLVGLRFDICSSTGLGTGTSRAWLARAPSCAWSAGSFYSRVSTYPEFRYSFVSPEARMFSFPLPDLILRKFPPHLGRWQFFLLQQS